MDSALAQPLHNALEAQVKAGAPSALGRIEAPGAGLAWAGTVGQLARDEGRPVQPDDAFRIASVSKSVTAAATVRLAGEGRVALDGPLGDQLPGRLLDRWSVFEDLPRITPRQLLAHTAGLPNYFGEEAFLARLREDPGRVWESVDLVDFAAEHGTPSFRPGEGFSYSDTGYVVAGILAEEVTDRPLHEVYRELIFDPLGMDDTWLEGHEVARRIEVAHHYTGELDWTTISPTIDWAGGGLVTTTADLARYVRGLWADRIVDSAGLAELTRWTPGASFPPESGLRYEQYGMGMGENTVEGIELLGHTGFIGAFAFYAPKHDAVLVGTHNESEVDRWPLVAAMCKALNEVG